MPQKKVLKIHVHDHKIKYIVLAWQDKYWFGQVAWNAPTLAPGQQMILTVEHSHENDVLWLSNQVTGEGNDCTGLSKFKFNSESFIWPSVTLY